jgi:tetratricopeptide (TPR) repeat protein
MNYTRFNRIENKKTFINVIRSYFDKKYALEQHIIEIYNQLEYAKREYNYDTYKELIIELISIERNRRQSTKIIDICHNTAKYFKNNHRYDLSILFYNNLIEEYRNRNGNLISDEYIFLGNIHEELGDVFTELNNHYEAINNFVRATHYLSKSDYTYKINSINFKIAIVKILSFKFLDSIFIIEKLIFENDKYLTNNSNTYYITLIILCYLSLFDIDREPYLQMNCIRKTLETYKKKYIDYCETIEYISLLNIISAVDNLDHEQFTMHAQTIVNNNLNSCLKMPYTVIFTHIHKYIQAKYSNKLHRIYFK